MMGTEPNIPPVYPLARAVRVRELAPDAWLAALRDGRTQIEVGHVGTGRVGPSWTTRPRTPEVKYDTHYLFYAGDAVVHVRLLDRTLVGGPGALAWLPPGVPYGVGLETSARGRTLHRLRFRILAAGAHLTPWRSACLIEGFASVGPLVETFGAELAVPGAHATERFRALLMTLSIEAFRRRDEARPDAPRLRRSQAQRLVDFVAARTGEGITPADLARELRLSSAYFARVFKRTFGAAPRRWIVEQRLEQGARLLRDTDLSIAEVAYRLGYAEARLFSRQFRRFLGTTPREYRRQH